VRRNESAKLWDLSDLTEDARLVLIVPEVVVERHPGTPGGYRVTHRYVDRSTLSPVALPLVVFELERVASGTPATGRDS
jgi:hypothetical protein